MTKNTTITLSIETYDELNSLKKAFSKFFKSPISFDQLIRALIHAKVDLASELSLESEG